MMPLTHLLFLQDESIDLGFKAIRDEFYFTTHRILFVDKHGITGKRTEYKSCPYHSIKAFSVETSGGFDSDSEMKVYAGSLDLSIDFDKKKVDIFEIQKYLSGHVFADSMEELLAYNTANPQQAFTGKEGGSSAKLMDYLAGDYFFSSFLSTNVHIPHVDIGNLSNSPVIANFHEFTNQVSEISRICYPIKQFSR